MPPHNIEPSSTDGQFLLTDSGKTVWGDGPTGGGGSTGLVDFVRVTLTSGDVPLNQTAVTTVSSSIDLSLNATAGDLIEYGISGRLTAVAQWVGFEVYTRPSGSNVNPFGPGLSASLATLSGVTAWLIPNEATYQRLSGSITRTLTADDVAAGATVLRLMYAKVTTTARTLSASANTPLEVWAMNHGQGF